MLLLIIRVMGLGQNRPTESARKGALLTITPAATTLAWYRKLQIRPRGRAKEIPDLIREIDRTANP